VRGLVKKQTAPYEYSREVAVRAERQALPGDLGERDGRGDARQAGRAVRPRALLLTGAPGIGKTTVMRRVAAKLGTPNLRGFCTEEIRERGERKGFRLIGLDGEERVIAHVDFPKGHRVGKYGVDVTAIDVASASLVPDPAAQVYLIDEIGKMECLSQRFVAAMRALLLGKTPVVATVGLRGGGFIVEVKRLEQCVLWQVTHENRDDLPSRVVDWLSETSRDRIGASRVRTRAPPARPSGSF
jgi:nucleoside-triphosphatase